VHINIGCAADFWNQVRAVTTNREAQLEADLECEMRGCSVNCNQKMHSWETRTSWSASFADNLSSFTTSLGPQASNAPLHGEEIFIAQLHYRARLLNSIFQERVMELVQSHALPDDENDMQEGGEGVETLQEIAAGNSLEDKPLVVEIGPCFEANIRKANIRDNIRKGDRAFSYQSGKVQLAEGAGFKRGAEQDSELVFSNPPGSNSHSISKREGQSSTGTRGPSLEVVCEFSGGSTGVVEVCSAAVKAVERMREKLSEYAAEGAAWPLAACILDPVRASVVCTCPAHVLEVAREWLLGAGKPLLGSCSGETGGPDGDRPEICKRFAVCKVKNKFALGKSQLVRISLHDLRASLILFTL
jgi:hypothetical protein